MMLERSSKDPQGPDRKYSTSPVQRKTVARLGSWASSGVVLACRPISNSLTRARSSVPKCLQASMALASRSITLPLCFQACETVWHLHVCVWLGRPNSIHVTAAALRQQTLRLGTICAALRTTLKIPVSPYGKYL